MKHLTIKNQITKKDNEAFGLYLRDISKIKPLTLQEEIDLAILAQQGDEDAIQKLAKGNLRFVVSVAKQYQHCGVPLSDLVSAGNIGLVKAAKRFDHTRGFKFISYAVWWIRQSITIAISEYLKTIRLPVNCEEAINEFSKVEEKLEQELGRKPSTDEVIDKLSTDSSKNKRHLFTTTYKPFSLDMSVNNDDDSTYHDIIPHETAMQDTMQMDQDVQKERLLSVVNKLTPIESKILIMRFGLDGKGTRSYDEIGMFVNLTGERIRQIQKKALRRLKANKAIKHIFNDFSSVT